VNAKDAPAESTGSGLAGAVLAGGRSRRMGTDKALLVEGGRTLLARALEALSDHGNHVDAGLFVASGAAPRYASIAAGLGAVEVHDDPRWGLDAGPLAGLEAALVAAQARGAQRLCVLACDMPNVCARTIGRLVELSRGADIAFACDDRFDHPLLGVYSVRCAPAIRASLERGERRMDSYFSALATDGTPLVLARIPVGRLADDIARAARLCDNLNRPADLARALERARSVSVAP